MSVRRLAALLAAVSCSPSGTEQEPWVWDLPAGFPAPHVPEGNAMTAAKVELGRHLFYDKRLSHNETMACASCHEQALAFTDGQATTEGSTGHALPRNAMSLGNVAYLSVYTSERAECYHCHAGPNFSTSFRSDTSEAGPPDFQNNGLYNLDAAGAYPPGNSGLFEFTGEPRDQGKFRVPTLRNIELTAPYMHDGSITTLAEVVEHYNAGGRTITDGPLAGDGRMNPNKSPLVFSLGLGDQEKADLVAFLESLTDDAFITYPRFAAP